MNKKGRLGKRIASLLLCLVMVLSNVNLPGFTTTAYAAGYNAGDISGTTGIGTESDPVICDNYQELKQALEYAGNLYIVVNYFGTKTYTPLICGTDYNNNDIAIKIPMGTTKHLTINTRVDLRATSINEDEMLYSFIENYGTLFISGDGRLNCGFNSYLPNAVIYNQVVGTLDVSGNIEISAIGDTSAHGRAIYNAGKMAIHSGTFVGDCGTKMPNGSCEAVYNASDYVSSISGGTFTCNTSTATQQGLALRVERDGKLTISAGVFTKGIEVKSGHTIEDYLAEGSTYTSDNDGTITVSDGTIIVDNPKEYKVVVESRYPTQGTVSGGGTYLEGTTATIVATPVDGYEFEFWTNTYGSVIENAGATYSFIIDDDVTYVAWFKESVDEKCGNDVYWHLNHNDGTLKIYGTGAMYDEWSDNAYLDYTDWDTAIIEEGVSRIGKSSFSIGSKTSPVTNLYIANSVESIGEQAFYYNTSLTNVYFHDNSKLKVIEEYAFANTNIIKIQLPYGTTTIGDVAFYESNLEEIIIPTTVTSIGSGAFNDTNLKKIIYNGTQEQWEKISIDANNPNLTAMVDEFLPSHTHSGTKLAQVDATCTTDGVKAYYECSCGKYFTDSECTQEIADLDAWKLEDGKIDATGNHDFSKCVSNGDGTHKVMCKDCDAVQEGHDKDTCSGGKATCTKKAKCTECGKEYGKLAEHTLKTITTKATLTADGKKETKCSVCGKVTKTTKIYAAKTVKLSKTTYTYDGKAKKPTVTIKDSKGKAIATTNYTVKYDDGRKNVGKYNVKITFKGDYKGSKTLTFTINPKATTLKSVTPASKAFTATWSKQTKQVDGYEIQYALDKNFTSSAKKIAVTKNTTTSKKISSLKSKKTYYVRVRTYKKVGTKKYYSDWSKVLNVKTK